VGRDEVTCAIADADCEVTETGSSLRAKSSAHRRHGAGNPRGVHHERAAAADTWKREKAERILILMLQGRYRRREQSGACSSMSIAMICRLF